MPKLICPCGHVINLSQIPVPGERVCFDGDQWDEVVKTVADTVGRSETRDPTLLAETISDTLAGFSYSIEVCPGCGRLAVPDRDGKRYRFYRPEPEASPPVE
jgi:hypothetical protein